MAYCTYTEVESEIGTSHGTITTSNITEKIAQSDKEIASKLRKKGLVAPTGANDDLNIASVQLTIAKIKRHQSQELSRANSVGLSDGTSFSTSPEIEAAAAERKAGDAILAYIASVNGSGIRASRVRSRCR